MICSRVSSLEILIDRVCFSEYLAPCCIRVSLRAPIIGCSVQLRQVVDHKVAERDADQIAHPAGADVSRRLLYSTCV